MLRHPAAKRWLTVDLTAMADTKDQDEHAGIFDFRDEAVVADTIFPKLAKLGSVQGLADAARVFERRDALVKKFQDALALQRVETCKFPGGGGG
jgi:hypothetical protein